MGQTELGMAAPVLRSLEPGAEGTSTNLSTKRQDALRAIQEGRSPGFLSGNPGGSGLLEQVASELGKILMET